MKVFSLHHAAAIVISPRFSDEDAPGGFCYPNDAQGSFVCSDGDGRHGYSRGGRLDSSQSAEVIKTMTSPVKLTVQRVDDGVGLCRKQANVKTFLSLQRSVCQRFNGEGLQSLSLEQRTL